MVTRAGWKYRSLNSKHHKQTETSMMTEISGPAVLAFAVPIAQKEDKTRTAYISRRATCGLGSSRTRARPTSTGEGEQDMKEHPFINQGHIKRATSSHTQAQRCNQITKTIYNADQEHAQAHEQRTRRDDHQLTTNSNRKPARPLNSGGGDAPFNRAGSAVADFSANTSGRPTAVPSDAWRAHV